MRTLVVGDIHGGLRGLEQALQRASISKDDHLIFLGDYVDGWSETAQVVQYLIELQSDYTCTFILGNHDTWCAKWLVDGSTNDFWLANGGQATIDSYKSTNFNDKDHRKFFAQLKLYHIDKEDRLFIHAGFSSMHGVYKEPYETNFYWDRTLWETALLAEHLNVEDLKLQAPRRFKHYKEIYIGHTSTTNYDTDQPMFAYNVINVDTGAGFTGRVTVMDIDTKEYWQSDPLPELYPDEKGRNKH